MIDFLSERAVRRLNRGLRLVGLAILPCNIGHWSVAPGGGLQCKVRRYGWRWGLARDAEEAQELTALGRFLKDQGRKGRR